MDESLVTTANWVAPSVTLGANFAGSNLSISGGIFPPDSNGAIGPGEFVELVNGAYRVYDKSGNVLQAQSLADFWISGGVTLQGFPTDPRILYDPQSERWFAAAIDYGIPNTSGNISAFLLGVSNTSDPTQGWHTFELGETFDFTRLGLNADGIYLAGTDGSAGIDLVVIPKSDLLGCTPTVAGATEIFSPFPTLINPQLTVAPGVSGAEPIVSLTPDALPIASIDPPVTAPVLNTEDRILTVPEGLSNTAGAVQKDSAIPINTGGFFVFSSSVVMQDGKLFAVQTIALNPEDQSHPGLRWFEIGDPLTNPVVLDSGIISPAGLDVYYGSIAVNPMGEVVIGFSGSGPNDFPSAYAVAGVLNGDDLEFGEPMLLKAGVAPETSGRFGDYSATTFDPTDPSHFWTIQEWTSDQGWSTQITEVVFATATTLPPVAHNDIAGASKSHNVSGNVLTNDTDPNHELLTVTAVTGATTNGSGQFVVVGAFGTLVMNGDGSFTYEANKKIDIPGQGPAQDTFTYTAANTDDLSAQATLTVTVITQGETYIGGTPGIDADHLSVVAGGKGGDVIDGSLGFEQISGGKGKDFIEGGPGDVLTGGRSSDTFAFSDDFGSNTVTDFGRRDTIQVHQEQFQNFATVIANAAPDGHGGTLISDPGNSANTIDLLGVSVASLHASGFSFV